jgi:hypothetical protein
MKTETTFKVGDKATFCTHTDCKAGYITSVSKSGKSVSFKFGKAKLLNGHNSGEPDALQFSAGGFCGHTSGDQRWEITPDDETDYTIKCTLRDIGNGSFKWKQVGSSTRSPGFTLGAGHYHHYDYNF